MSSGCVFSSIASALWNGVLDCFLSWNASDAILLSCGLCGVYFIYF